jgi:hypothetical protein
MFAMDSMHGWSASIRKRRTILSKVCLELTKIVRKKISLRSKKNYELLKDYIEIINSFIKKLIN